MSDPTSTPTNPTGETTSASGSSNGTSPTGPTGPTGPIGPNGTSPAAASGDTATVSPAVIKFKSCRWRRPPEDGPECCGHRDVLPIAGTSFNPEAWCPDCAFYKLRRTPKKRSPDEYRY